MNNYDLSTLSSYCKCSLMSDASGKIAILHDKKLPFTPQWIEFQKDHDDLSLVDESGRSFPLGAPFKYEMAANLKQGQIVQFILVGDNVEHSFQDVPFVIQDY